MDVSGYWEGAFYSVHVEIRGQKNSGVELHLPSCLPQGLFFTTGYPRLPEAPTSPTSSQRVSCLYLPSHSKDTEVTDTCYCVQLCMSSGDSNSGTHSHVASMLPTEPSSQPLTQLLPAKDTNSGHLNQKQVCGSRINTDLSPETKEVTGGQRH